MAGISITNIINELVEPAPAFRFEVILPEITTANGLTIKAPSAIYAQRVSIGGVSINSEEMYWAGWQKSFGQGSQSEDVSITFVEKFDYSMYRYFYEWKNLIHSLDGLFGLPGGEKGYWKNITFFPLDTTGRRKAKFLVKETWPIHIPAYEYDGTSTNYIMPNVTFKNFQTEFSMQTE